MIFFRRYFSMIFWRIFWWVFFWWILLANFYNELFWRFFWWVFFDDFFGQNFCRSFWQFFYLLTIASFRIGVPSILFFVFLGLRIFTRIYCIWSETREQNLNDLLSYNGPQFLIKNRFTNPNDLKQPLFLLFLICSLLFDLSSTGLIKKRGTQCFISRKREPCTNDLHQPQFLIKNRFTYPNDLKQPLFLPTQ